MKRTSLLKLSTIAAFAALGVGGARAADPVITDPAITTIGKVTGGDVGEGLDLEGDFPYALSIGAEADFTTKIRDASFKGLIDAEVPGATLEAGNRILNWYVVDYGDSANDDALEAATSSIRWSAAGSGIPEVRLTLENLQVGTQYKFQMTFGEQCCNRGFDILFDDALVVKDLNPGVVHDGVANGKQQAVVTHLYTPKTSTVVLRFDGNDSSTDYADHNAILNSVIVEKLGIELDTDKDGMPDSYETRNGFNPNDPSDAAKDFDGDGVSNLDEFKAGTNATDVTKPTIVASAGSPSLNSVTLTFSEDLDPATATVPGNYTITPALSVTAATYAKKVVTLTTAAQTPGATAYTVAVKGVKDTSKNEVAAGTTTTIYSYLLSKAGAIKISVYEAITGGLDALYSDPKYPASPDRVGACYSFTSRDFLPTDALENYGAVMEGLLTPTEAGSYRFFVHSDDASQLFLSTDDKEANLAQIAEEPGCCNNFTEPDGSHPRTSEPIALVAGKSYLIRLVYKEGGGGDYGRVAWRKEGDTTPAASLTPIAGKFLSSTVDLPAPPDGAITLQSPAPNAKKVSPAAAVRIAHRDGKTAWTAQNVSLKFDGSPVTPTFTKDGALATIVYQPAGLYASGSIHTVSLTYPDPGGNNTTLEWSFTAASYKGPVLDNVKGYAGLILGSADFTADKGGRTGGAGDLAIDLTTKGGPVQVVDNAFLAAVNAATASDELSVSMWIKKYDIADSSAVWFSSPSQARVFQAHTPWSNNNIYFDTAGCCDGATQRISADVAGFADYSGDVTWWNSWHHFAFTKKAGAKQIWIDGKLFLEGENTGPLSTDIDQLMIGSDNAGGGLMHGYVDDFAVFSKALTEANVNAIKSGTKPTDLAAAGPIAFWDFNTKPAEPSTGPTFGITRSGNKVTITSVAPLGAGFVLETAPSINGPWTVQAGATTPVTVDIGANNAFLRAVKR